MKKFIEEKEYKIEFPTHDNSRVEFSIYESILNTLAERTWSLLIAPNNGPELICSDHPVTLTWKDGRNGPVGYGQHLTEVYFPLCPNMCFYGVYENFLKPVVELSPERVARINGNVAFNAKRHIYSKLNKYIVWRDNKLIEVYCGESS